MIRLLGIYLLGLGTGFGLIGLAHWLDSFVDRSFKKWESS